MLCACGCGQEAKKGNRFIQYHNARVASHTWRKPYIPRLQQDVLDKYFMDKSVNYCVENDKYKKRGLKTHEYKSVRYY